MARPRPALAGACVVLAALAAPGAASAQTTTCVGAIALANGGFEDPATVSEFGILKQANVPGWSTTEPDGRIELWQSGYKGVPAAAGEQFAELAANEPGELYQDLPTVPGTLLG
jgi:hypothetical protein